MRRDLAIVAAIFLWEGCAAGPADGETRQPLVVERPLLAGAGLCEARVFRSPRGQWLVNPRWQEDGQALRVRGKNGRGEFLLQPDMARLRPLPRLAEKVGIKSESASPELRQELLLAKDGIRIFWEPYRGLLLQKENGGETILASGAWGAVASPDGEKLAWCTGPLSGSQLWLYRSGGEPEALDAGAQPAWLDAHRLVFSVPEAAAEGAPAPIAEADLALFDLRDGQTRRLTATAGRLEMNPAAGPGGWLAWSDWSDGSIGIGRLCTDEEVSP